MTYHLIARNIENSILKRGNKKVTFWGVYSFGEEQLQALKARINIVQGEAHCSQVKLDRLKLFVRLELKLQAIICRP